MSISTSTVFSAGLQEQSVQEELTPFPSSPTAFRLLSHTLTPIVETSVTSIRPRRCTGLGLCIPCIHRMAHSDTSALNASGVKGIDVGATATVAGCSGKTQLHGDPSFVFLRPADQKLWVFEDFEALKLLFRGRSRWSRRDF